MSVQTDFSPHFSLNKSPKEQHVEERISERVSKIVADGCDMTKGRARIPLEIPTKPAEGDIRKYSANAIEKVRISKGNEHPLKIEIEMTKEVGFFQVEGVLTPKIQSSPAKHLVELYAGVIGEDVKRYF